MFGTSVPAAVLILLTRAVLVAHVRVDTDSVEYACTVVGAHAPVRADEDGEDAAAFLTVVPTPAVPAGRQGSLRVAGQAA